MAEPHSSHPPTEPALRPAPVRDPDLDSVTFDQGRGLLIGLTGCSPERAATALESASAQLGISPVAAAGLLLASVTRLDEPDCEAFVVQLEQAAYDTRPGT
jgi:hypothetical protein